MTLTSAEWKLLHRAIDLVDERRAAPVNQADMLRVKNLALDIYRDQGIGVDEGIIEQAIRDAAGPMTVDGGKDVAVGGGELGSMQKAERRWQAAEHTAATRRWEQELRNDPIARLSASIDKASAPLIAHRPVSDAQLAGDMARAMVREVKSFRRMGQWARAGWAAALVGTGLLGWQIVELMQGSASAFAVVGSLILTTGGRGAWLIREQHDGAGARVLCLMRGQTALATGDYDNEDLKKGAAIAGHTVRGSLKPVDAAIAEALHRRANEIAGDDRVVGRAWASWDFTHAPMRENDFRVLQALRTVRARHPFHSIKRLRGMSTGQY